MGKSLWTAFNVSLLTLLPLPLLIVVVMSFSPGHYFAFPPTGFSFVWYRQFFSSPQWLLAFGISFVIATCVAAAVTSASFLAALGLEHAAPGVRAGIDALVLSPLIFPQTATGVAFLGFFTVTHYLRGSYFGLALAHATLCLPFAYRPIAASFSKLDRSLAEAATNLGARRRTILWRVTLPQLLPGVITAALFAFIISFDEITVTLLLTAPGITTLPLHIYFQLEMSASPVVAAVSTILIAITLALVLVIQRAVGLGSFAGVQRRGAMEGSSGSDAR